MTSTQPGLFRVGKHYILNSFEGLVTCIGRNNAPHPKYTFFLFSDEVDIWEMSPESMGVWLQRQQRLPGWDSQEVFSYLDKIPTNHMLWAGDVKPCDHTTQLEELSRQVAWMEGLGKTDVPFQRYLVRIKDVMGFIHHRPNLLYRLDGPTGAQSWPVTEPFGRLHNWQAPHPNYISRLRLVMT